MAIFLFYIVMSLRINFITPAEQLTIESPFRPQADTDVTIAKKLNSCTTKDFLEFEASIRYLRIVLLYSTIKELIVGLSFDTHYIRCELSCLLLNIYSIKMLVTITNISTITKTIDKQYIQFQQKYLLQ